ncbi:MAG: RHS repeat-associated core domain-containing protein, partial [Myxococcota bacterium]
MLDWTIDGPTGADAAGTFAYDAVNRIASRTRSAPGLAAVSESFSYDALGNLTLLGGEPQRFEHASKPHAITSRGATTYAHDASGNLARAAGRHFRFDSADRLVCVGSAAGQCDVLRAVYDAQGDRVAEQAGATWRGFIGPEQVRTIADGVDASRLEITAFGERVAYAIIEAPRVAAALPLFELEVPPWAFAVPPLSALLTCLALALRGGLLAGIARRPVRAGLTAVLVAAVAIPSPAFAGGGGWSWQFSYRWVLSDALGSGLAVLDETGLLLHQTRFEPFGAVDAGEFHAAADHPPRRYFAGHPEQAETGLHYMNARWLDPETGTFLSVDPVVRDVAKSQSLNGYAYAENNPIAFNDPTGACLPPECRTYGLVSSGYIPSHAVVV